LRGVYTAGVASEDHAAGMRMVVQAMLLSPHFLYRTELGPEGAPPRADAPLTQYELASQLSFLFTATRPDDELLPAADRGELSHPNAGRAPAVRLLAKPAARDQVRRFFDAWLDLARWSTVKKDPAIYPEFTDEIRDAMIDEAERTIDDALWNRGGTLGELLGA